MSVSKTGRLTHDVYACAGKVFAELGGGRDKQAYMEAVYAELSSSKYINGLERNPQLAVFYKGKQLAHTVSADFKIVYNGNVGLVYVVVLKQVSASFQLGLIKMLSATKCKAAVILNFGKAAPDFSRVYVPEG
ncbi:hypothetical protein FACS1894190_05590 [Spirochaetia bacterium]|nr:hypothetical protein FACS1894190_05590 [Spirochaetia bacterium]GHV23131.1 hypothetical protein FACS189494_10840 [Spirochaetia bacterium]